MRLASPHGASVFSGSSSPASLLILCALRPWLNPPNVRADFGSAFMRSRARDEPVFGRVSFTSRKAAVSVGIQGSHFWRRGWAASRARVQIYYEYASGSLAQEPILEGHSLLRARPDFLVQDVRRIEVRHTSVTPSHPTQSVYLPWIGKARSEEHTSELQSLRHL